MAVSGRPGREAGLRTIENSMRALMVSMRVGRTSIAPVAVVVASIPHVRHNHCLQAVWPADRLSPRSGCGWPAQRPPAHFQRGLTPATELPPIPPTAASAPVRGASARVPALSGWAPSASAGVNASRGRATCSRAGGVSTRGIPGLRTGVRRQAGDGPPDGTISREASCPAYSRGKLWTLRAR